MTLEFADPVRPGRGKISRHLIRRIRVVLVAVGMLGLPGCFDTATVRDGRLRSEQMVSVSVPIYSGSLARGRGRARDCLECEGFTTFETTLPWSTASMPLVAVRPRIRATDWLALGASMRIMYGVGASLIARVRIFELSWAAVAASGELGGGVSPAGLLWSNRISLDASVDPLRWLAIYASPHLGQMRLGGEAHGGEGWTVGTTVWGVNGGLRWQLGAVVALYTELGWTRSWETEHSVLTPTLGIAFDLSK